MELDATACRKLIFQGKKVGICTRIKGCRFARRGFKKQKNHPLRVCFSGLLINVRSQLGVNTLTDDLSIIYCCVLLKQSSEVLL